MDERGRMIGISYNESGRIFCACCATDDEEKRDTDSGESSIARFECDGDFICWGCDKKITPEDAPEFE